MHSVMVMMLVAFIAPANTKDSMEELLEDFVDKLVNKISNRSVDKLVNELVACGKSRIHCFFDSICIDSELRPSEAAKVHGIIERWKRIRQRVAALEPVLQREQRLVEMILDKGLNEFKRKDLGRLVSHGIMDSALAIQLEKAIGDDAEKLQEVLLKNQREFLLLCGQVLEDKQDVMQEFDEIKESLDCIRNALLDNLKREKEGSHPDGNLVSSMGRSFNSVRLLRFKLENERRELTRRSSLASLLVAVCRRILPIRVIDPRDLREIPPSHEGYLKILEFYVFSDASKYRFGLHDSGPNWFTQLKRNVAIFAVFDASQGLVYNQFAVSGEKGTPGAPMAYTNGSFKSIEAPDEHGHIFDRCNDAEFKLLNEFAKSFPCREFHGHGVLWTKKPLCASCAGGDTPFVCAKPN